MHGELPELEREYREILHSWEFAIAMGHGCSMNGRDPRLQPVVDRADELARLIRDHRVPQ